MLCNSRPHTKITVFISTNKSCAWRKAWFCIIIPWLVILDALSIRLCFVAGLASTLTYAQGQWTTSMITECLHRATEMGSSKNILRKAPCLVCLFVANLVCCCKIQVWPFHPQILHLHRFALCLIDLHFVSLNSIRADLYPPDVTRGILWVSSGSSEARFNYISEHMWEAKMHFQCFRKLEDEHFLASQNTVLIQLEDTLGCIRKIQADPRHRSQYPWISASAGIPGMEPPKCRGQSAYEKALGYISFLRTLFVYISQLKYKTDSQLFQKMK